MTVTARQPVQTGGVKTFSPRSTVTLKKNIGRSDLGGNTAASDRFTGQQRQYDLTGYIGASGGWLSERSTRGGPGRFNVTLADRLSPGSQDSLYGLIEPLDIIEIRAARDPSASAGGDLPIVFRGFVGDVKRSQVMTDRGPIRQVVLGGQDYGRILQLMNVVYFFGYPLGQDTLTELKFTTNWAGGDTGAVDVKDVADFVEGVMSNVITKFISDMQGAAVAGLSAGGSSPVVQLQLDVESARGTGNVQPLGVEDWPGGDVWSLLTHFGDVGPFNELYVRDDDSGPTLVFRPNPYRKLDGTMIQDQAQQPTLSTVYDEQVIALEAERSDADVANYFWVDAPRFNLNDAANTRAQAGASASATDAAGGDSFFALTDYPNADPHLYGIRFMQVTSQQGLRTDGASQSVLQQGLGLNEQAFQNKRRILLESNQDNVVFEKGIAVLRGDETIQHGNEIRFRRGPDGKGLTYKAYAHTVRHEGGLGAFKTTVTFDRGLGFYERAQHEGGKDSPYFSETSLRGAYGA